MRIKDWLEKSRKIVAPSEAELMLASLLELKDRSELILRKEEELTDDAVALADEMVSSRSIGVPLAYLLKKREFYGRDFEVSSDVLIPRPETETMVDLALEHIRFNDTEAEKNWAIYDIGTGSGCIAATMALELAKMDYTAEVIACDISRKALKIAMENYWRLGGIDVKDEIKFNCVRSNLLNNLKIDANRPTIVMANLPYVSREWEWIDQQALGFEPEMALYADDDGLALIKKLTKEFSKRFLGAKNAVLMLESDPSQVKDIKSYAKANGLKFVKTSGYIMVFIPALLT